MGHICYEKQQIYMVYNHIHKWLILVVNTHMTTALDDFFLINTTKKQVEGSTVKVFEPKATQMSIVYT